MHARGDPDAAPRAATWLRRAPPAAWAALRRHPWRAAATALLLGLLVLLLLWDWNWFKPLLERQVEARTGRSFDIDGDLDVDLGWTPTISASRVAFGNASWASQPVMASARHVALDIEVWPLLRGELRIPELRLQAPRLRLETGPGGRGNWQFGDSGGDGPQFRRLWIDDGRLRYLDAARDTDIRVAMATGRPARADAAPPIVASGGGRWRGAEFTVRGRAESPLGLGDADSPYQIDVQARAGVTRAHARGSLLDPLRLRGFDLQLELAGHNMAELYPLVGLALPPTPPYTLEGRFRRDGTTWRYTGFTGRVGDSDLAGDASVDTGGPRPYLRADLLSKRLDFKDLAGFVGDPSPGSARDDTPGRVLPDTPYRLERLRAMDADVRLRAQRINARSLPLEDMDAHLLLDNGLLKLDPLDFGVATGEIRSTVRMDARGEVIRTRAEVQARGLDLSQLLPEVELARNAIGEVGGAVTLAGEGNSIAAMLGSSDGDVAIGMGRGRISNLLMEKAGIDLAEIIKYKLTGDRLIPVRCAFGDFAVEDGVMTARALAFDTTDTLLIGEGTIDLGSERLDLTIHPRPKDRSLLSLRAPLLLEGSFADPSIRPDMGQLGLRGAIALTLASIAPPAALLATLELGPGENVDCGGQYAK